MIGLVLPSFTRRLIQDGTTVSFCGKSAVRVIEYRNFARQITFSCSGNRAPSGRLFLNYFAALSGTFTVELSESEIQ